MEGKSKGLAVTVAIVAAIGISLLAMLAVLNRRDQSVGLNQEIQYDDFAFSVLGVRKASTLERGDSPVADRFYYVVTIRISNHAKRVNYTFKTTAAILVDDRGREFHLSTAGQHALESTLINRCSEPIPAGASCITEIAFDLPAEARPSQLRISEGGAIGDILDVVFYGRKRIELAASQQ
ncbi:MAG: DUF4352 domain-containing protein [Blastocatellia bacterium]